MNELSIHIPQNFAPEIKYSFEILMQEFLGIPISVTSNNSTTDYIISGKEIKSIKIKNQFFSKYTETSGYIHKAALPTSVSYWTDTTLAIHNLPVLYGKNKLEFTDYEYLLHADIISSAFFMLSRWEEKVDTEKDSHQRSTAKNSIAYKYNFLHRPIVNEYADALYAILQKAGYTGTRQKHTFKSIVTHDVDNQYKWPDLYTSIKHLGGDLVKRKDWSLFGKNLKSFYNTKIKHQNDPYDTHDYILSLAKKFQTQVYFNFIVSRETKDDVALPLDDIRFASLINKIEDQGHTIGFHPGYNTYLDQDKFNTELHQLQSITKQEIKTGRQHFLRFQIPHTWRLWEKANMTWDSSMSYSDLPGFRSGTCYTYTVFDILTRQKLQVQEKPLIVMDATLVYYMTAFNWDSLYTLKDQCKKHGGEFVSIWHNDLVHMPSLQGFEELIYQ